ncbi:hypothetical protein FJZ48_01105 [Candidatus Uhrbacteria bacterium]|nr:hypothetical protein [Candidatus Uhrbacteria bacterium]
MSYSVRVHDFEGPLDLLLQLIEGEKMEITNVSLMAVTEPFVKQVEAQKGKVPPEELADFLVIAAKLIYLKSKALLPSFLDPALEEGPDLESQLRLYKAFVEAARQIGEMAMSGSSLYGRSKRMSRMMSQGFVAPTGVSSQVLRDLYQRVIQRLEPLIQLPKAAVERVISIEDKILELGERVKRHMKTSFHRFLAEAKDRGEMIVSFLALLELIKLRSVNVTQEHVFHDIQLESYET